MLFVPQTFNLFLNISYGSVFLQNVLLNVTLMSQKHNTRDQNIPH